MKLLPVFGIIGVLHLALIAILFTQPGCQTSQQPPDASLTRVENTQPMGQPSAPQTTGSLDPAFNSAIAPSEPKQYENGLATPMRPPSKRREEPNSNLLEPVLSPVVQSVQVNDEVKDYTIQSGDTLSGIARRQGVSLQNLLEANGFDRNATIYVGQSIVIPVEDAVEAPPQSSVTVSNLSEYVVKSGDTLSKIASLNGTTVSEIKRANRLRSDTIRIGQKLSIPQGSPRSQPARATVQEHVGQVTYVVQKGDTPGAIARKFGVTTNELMRANKISDPRKLYAGKTLVIPRAGQVQPAVSREIVTTRVTEPTRRMEPVSVPESLPATAESQESSEDSAASMLEILEDEDIPFVEVEEVESESTPTN